MYARLYNTVLSSRQTCRLFSCSSFSRPARRCSSFVSRRSFSSSSCAATVCQDTMVRRSCQHCVVAIKIRRCIYQRCGITMLLARHHSHTCAVTIWRAAISSSSRRDAGFGDRLPCAIAVAAASCSAILLANNCFRVCPRSMLLKDLERRVATLVGSGACPRPAAPLLRCLRGGVAALALLERRVPGSNRSSRPGGSRG